MSDISLLSDKSWIKEMEERDSTEKIHRKEQRYGQGAWGKVPGVQGKKRDLMSWISGQTRE